MKTTQVSKLNHNQILKSEGLALEYYPCYINLTKQLHSVDVVLLSFIIKGSGTHYLGEKAYQEKGVSLSVTHFGQVHDIVTKESGMEIMNIYINPERYRLPEMPEELQNVLHQILPTHPNFFLTPGHMTRLEFDPDSPVVGIVMSMYREFKTQGKAWRDLLHNYFRIFLAECCRLSLHKGINILGKEKSTSHHLMEPIRQFLDLNYAGHISIKTLAKRSGFTGPYLCRLFKEYTGKSVFDYILDKKIQTAMTSLKLTDRKISFIAMECGFQDISFFNKVFKRKLEMSPREYRLKHSS